MKRRRPKPEKVREIAETLPELVSREWGDGVVRLRRAMHRASTQIDAGQPEQARSLLESVLQGRP